MKELSYDPIACQVMTWCDQLAKVTSVGGTISRFYLTPQHTQATALVKEWLQDAGMSVRIDAANNLIGHYPGATSAAPVLILGSHLDTVANAGRYDGILGVMIAIAAVSRLHYAGVRLPFAIDVVGFGDEAGARFGRALLGSRAMAGSWSNTWWALQDSNGVSLRDAFNNAGLLPDNIQEASRAADFLLGYIEIHIEQGPVLESMDSAVGVVTAIAGARRYWVSLTGFTGHAGTVPMSMRRDALSAAAEAIQAIERIAAGYKIVATVGAIECKPGAVNVIPGDVRFSLDIRSGSDYVRDLALEKIQQTLKEIFQRRQVTASWEEIHNAPATGCAAWLQDVQTQVLKNMNLPVYSLMSGAGHDAMAIADITDVAMYFIRCKKGISQQPEESVREDDVAQAIEVLEKTLLLLAERLSFGSNTG
ncbi:allantoate amidohydrolase [Cellvibrio polysaccharolyticus]|uniref:Allantoate amidohydrolase n=1 Tax=Cellvibrio polysaccharolyticus TaxID=2082724 RepID=A0A928YWU8_9GAMM|nr:allantoate amidohydrolase [Cellvibrio polysaccharolyticus]MBE8718603.1 allantoate amidohydrolase [Cellvibrio polysaccharolyticus]